MSVFITIKSKTDYGLKIKNACLASGATFNTKRSQAQAYMYYKCSHVTKNSDSSFENKGNRANFKIEYFAN